MRRRPNRRGTHCRRRTHAAGTTVLSPTVCVETVVELGSVKVPDPDGCRPAPAMVIVQQNVVQWTGPINGTVERVRASSRVGFRLAVLRSNAPSRMLSPWHNAFSSWMTALRS
jgi:hypothetical protein